MREQARVVIIGAGIVGCSAAYYLTQLGWSDVVVLDQGPLFSTGGSTSHAPGLMFQLNASRSVTQFARDSAALYSALNTQQGDGPVFAAVGSLEIATTPQRWEELKRKEGHARSWGLPAELIGPAEAGRLVPLMHTDRLHGALYVPSDGVARAVAVAQALAAVAQQRGAAFYGETPVTGIETAGGRVRAVVTPRGRVAAEHVLLCAGIWGPRVGRLAGVPIPLVPVQHQYARTAPLAALMGETREIAHPIIRHQDASMYFRQHGAAYGIGSYHHEPLLVNPDDLPSPDRTVNMPAQGETTNHGARTAQRNGGPHGTGSAVLPFTPEHFDVALEEAAALFPALRGAPLDYTINGMFSFTPDGQSLLGESPDVRGFWVAEAIWVTHGGGAGKAIAEWMVEGAPAVDVREVDLNRFHRHAHSPAYRKVRGAQQYREVYDIIHPLQQIAAPRPLRVSPFYQRQRELGAEFFEGAGWERPQWFAGNERLLEGQQVPARTGWAAQGWSPIIAAEHRAARERVALFDLTPFTKLEVAGPGALAYLQHLAANDLDRPAGKVTYTALLDHRGRIQVDLTVTRLDDQRFLVVTGAATGMRDLAWLSRHLPDDGSVQLHDLTSALCCLGVWGPRARALVGRAGEDQDTLSPAAFPYFTARALTIGHVPVLAVAVSYVGEAGWEIYAPTEYGLALWDTLWESGQALGVTAAGGGAFDSLRLEKGYRLWGSDIHTDHDPFEAGLGFAVRLTKGEFLGREALLRRKEQGLTRKLCCLVLDDPRMVLMGKEPILAGDRVLGYVTSANYGYTVGRSIAYGYLPAEYAAEGTTVAVQYFGRRCGATVAREPLYDPRNTRPRM